MTDDDLASRLGIFARTFRRDTPAEVAAAVSAAGYALAHWNFAAIGRATLAADVDEDQFSVVRNAFHDHGLGIPSVSGTFNMINPHIDLRDQQIEAAIRLIRLVGVLGADVVTLCTGTRDPDNMWQAHASNTDPSAWSDLRRSLDPLLEAASDAGVRLGVEPELGNAVRDAPTAAGCSTNLGQTHRSGSCSTQPTCSPRTPSTSRTRSLVRPLICSASESSASKPRTSSPPAMPPLAPVSWTIRHCSPSWPGSTRSR